MSDRKHTAGPWLIGAADFDDEGRSIYVPGEIGQYQIVECVGGRIYKDENGEFNDRSEIDANTYLISAAPDLMEAALQAKRLIDEALPKFNWGDSFLDADAIRLLNETPGVIDAALAKARGEK